MEASSKAQEFSLRSINVTQTAIQIADVAEAKNLANHQARQKGAIKRHEENRQLKADVFEWLDKNFQTLQSKGKSMDAIAEDLQGIVPVGFRTRRHWVTEWKKCALPADRLIFSMRINDSPATANFSRHQRTTA